MKKIQPNFHDIRNASLDTGGRNDIPQPARRAHGGCIEMRSAGGSDADHDQPRGSRRATGGRSRARSHATDGLHPKRRADRAPRKKGKS